MGARDEARARAEWLKVDLGAGVLISGLFMLAVPALAVVAVVIAVLSRGGGAMSTPGAVVAIIGAAVMMAPGILVTGMATGIRVGFDPGTRTIRSNLPWPGPTPYGAVERVALFPYRGGVGLALWRQTDVKPLVVIRASDARGPLLDADQWRAIHDVVTGSHVSVEVHDRSPAGTPLQVPLTVLAPADVLALFDRQVAAVSGDLPVGPEPITALVDRARRGELT